MRSDWQPAPLGSAARCAVRPRGVFACPSGLWRAVRARWRGRPGWAAGRDRRAGAPGWCGHSGPDRRPGLPQPPAYGGRRRPGGQAPSWPLRARENRGIAQGRPCRLGCGLAPERRALVGVAGQVAAGTHLGHHPSQAPEPRAPLGQDPPGPRRPGGRRGCRRSHLAAPHRLGLRAPVPVRRGLVRGRLRAAGGFGFPHRTGRGGRPRWWPRVSTGPARCCGGDGEGREPVRVGSPGDLPRLPGPRRGAPR
jgi:hypothetical protein